VFLIDAQAKSGVQLEGKNMNKLYHFFHKHYHLKYHGVYSHAKKLFVFDIALLVGSILMLGSALFFFFWQPDLTGFIDLNFSIGNERIRSGEEVTFKVDYVNRSKYKLLEPKLALHLPEGFIPDRSKTPEDYFNKDSIIYFKDLEPGAKGSAAVYGTLWTTPGAEERLNAILSYRSEKNNALEQKITPLYLKLAESVITGELTLPDSTFPSAELPATLTIKNNSSDKEANIYLTNNWPLAIKIFNLTEPLVLKPGDTKTITGNIPVPNTSGDLELKLNVGVHTTKNEVDQVRIIKKVSVFRPNLVSRIELNGQNKAASLGGVVPIRVYWKNASQSTLKSLRLVLKSDPGIVDLTKTARENNLRVSDGHLVVDSARRTALSSADPNVEDSFTLNIYLKQSFGLYGSTVKNWLLQPSLELTSEQAGQGFTAPGTGLTLPIATEISMTATARYYTSEGDQLGRGPLPPVVGETTRYWIFVQFTNSINPIEDVTFRAELSPGTTYSGNQSVTIGRPISAAGNTLTWSQTDIPAQTQTGLYFGVEVTPGAGSVGQNLNLVKNIFLTTTDAITGEKITVSKGVVTNVLPTNDRGANQGSLVSE